MTDTPTSMQISSHSPVLASSLNGPRQHLLDVDDLSDAELSRLYERAIDLQRRMWAGLSLGARGPLHGQVVATLFFEASTRTRLSFELAAQRLGALTMPLEVSRSSLEKSESLFDTLQTLAAMGATIAVVRHSDNGVFSPHLAGAGISLLNAGNGTAAHPTQALLDAYTLMQHLGTLRDRVIVINGDIRHSRVARSNLRLLSRLGARVIFSGPPDLLPDAKSWASLADQNEPPRMLALDDAIEQADVIMCLRIQHERHHVVSPALSNREHTDFLSAYGLTEERFARAKPTCLILHPGPVNRDVEIASALAEHPRSLILEQVRNGLFIRMATLEWVAGVLP